jgi:UDP-N-acetylmuramoylalanine-D-glutamate ligase
MEIEKSMNTKVDRKITLSDADSMELAVKISKENTPTGKICLLSTASPSYNMFKNFEEKGERFAKEISR